MELPCPPPGDLPNPGIELASLMSPALATEFFITSTTWETTEELGTIQIFKEIMAKKFKI